MPIICIIEDDPAFSAALERVMARHYTVHTMTRLPDDLAEMTRIAPDIIFLDCMLPGESGLDIVRRLRAADVVPHAGIILMSAYHDMLDKARDTDMAGLGYLRKPCTVRQVMELVHRHFADTPHGELP